MHTANGGAELVSIECSTWEQPEHAYSVEFLVIQHPDEPGYRTACPRLPGALSQGDTIEEAAYLMGMDLLPHLLAAYIQGQGRIPWRAEDDPEALIESEVVVQRRTVAVRPCFGGCDVCEGGVGDGEEGSDSLSADGA